MITLLQADFKILFLHLKFQNNPLIHTLRITVASKSQSMIHQINRQYNRSLIDHLVYADAFTSVSHSIFPNMKHYCSQLTYEETEAQKGSNISVTESKILELRYRILLCIMRSRI